MTDRSLEKDKKGNIIVQQSNTQNIFINGQAAQSVKPAMTLQKKKKKAQRRREADRFHRQQQEAREFELRQEIEMMKGIIYKYLNIH